MSREIKFEFVFQHVDSKDIKFKRFTLDEITNGFEDDLFMLECDCEPVGETNVVECNCEDHLEDFRVIAKRQYTGLKDKNGKEIYEGDIIENTLAKREWICPKNKQTPYYRNMKRKTRYVVIWDDHWACWEFTKKTERGKLEIIGNIYENSELLEATDD